MRKILAVALLIVMLLGLCACTALEKSIVGTWKNQSTVLGIVTETIYTFNEDGTGSKTNIVSVSFTYSFSEEKLLITTSTLGIENTEEYTFDFKGNKLVLTGERDTIELEKVK